MKKKLNIILIIIIFVAIFTSVGVKYYLDKDIDNQKKELEKTILKYGYVEKESVSVSVKNFNKEVKNNNIGTQASDDYSVEENDIYWYGLTSDISLYVLPSKYTGDKEKDITDRMGIQYTNDEKTALLYAKTLIKANNENLTDSDIDYLINEAKELSSSKKNSNNGKGISVSYIDYGDKKEWQVIRLYK